MFSAVKISLLSYADARLKPHLIRGTVKRACMGIYEVKDNIFIRIACEAVFAYKLLN